MPSRLESDVEKATVKWAKDNGWQAWKLVNLGSRGFPDRWFVKPGPTIVIIEFKAPGKRARKLQVYICKLLIELGFNVFLDVDDEEVAKRILKSYDAKFVAVSTVVDVNGEDAQRWRPIATAPKDRSEILLLNSRKGRAANGYWLSNAYDGNGAWIWPYVHLSPTHWMPLVLPNEDCQREAG